MFIETVVSMDKNGYISSGQELPWKRLKKEEQIFHELTRNSSVLLGSKTASTVGQSYEDRDLVCITHNPNKRRKDDRFQNIDYFISSIENINDVSKYNRTVIGGGAQTFRSFIEFSDLIHATVVLDEFEGDKRFCKYVSPYKLIESERFQSVEGQPDIIYNKYRKNSNGDTITLY